jgi:hypothetical protein
MITAILKRLQRYVITVITLFIAVIIIRCDKTPVGYDELGRGTSDSLYLFNFRPASRFCYGKYIPLGSADYMVLGKNTEYESRILMQFPLVDSSLEEVTSVKLILYPERHKDISFSIHPIAKSSEWTEGNATWMKMDAEEPWLTNGGDFYPVDVKQQATLTSDSWVIDLKLNKLDTLVNHSYGIILIPDASVQDFATISSKSISGKAPKIVLQYPSVTKTYQSTQDCHIIDTLNLNLTPLDLWVGAGFAFRTMLKFNLDTIPDNITIAYAELVLPVASHASISDTFNIGLYRILDPSFNNLTTYADNVSSVTQYLTATDTVVILDVRKTVQFWNKYNGKNSRPDSNFGVLVTVYPENNEISRVQLKTGSIKPYLKIGYIMPPSRRF